MTQLNLLLIYIITAFCNRLCFDGVLLVVAMTVCGYVWLRFTVRCIGLRKYGVRMGWEILFLK